MYILIKSVLLSALYISLFLLLSINAIKMSVFYSFANEAIVAYSLGYWFNVLLRFLVGIYLTLLIMLYLEVSRFDHFEEMDAAFWKKILILKPFSGIFAFIFCKNKNIKIYKMSILIKVLYYLKNIFFYTSLLFFLFMFLLKKPDDLFLIAAIIGIHSTIFMHFIFEPLVLIDAWNRSKEEWQDLNYYEYFLSIKPKLNYSEYFKRHFKNT